MKWNCLSIVKENWYEKNSHLKRRRDTCEWHCSLCCFLYFFLFTFFHIPCLFHSMRQLNMPMHVMRDCLCKRKWRWEDKTNFEERTGRKKKYINAPTRVFTVWVIEWTKNVRIEWEREEKNNCHVHLQWMHEVSLRTQYTKEWVVQWKILTRVLWCFHYCPNRVEMFSPWSPVNHSSEIVPFILLKIIFFSLFSRFSFLSSQQNRCV